MIPNNTNTDGSGVPYSGATDNLNLGAFSLTATGITDSSLTASKMVITDANKKLASSESPLVRTQLWPVNSFTHTSLALNNASYYHLIMCEESVPWSGVKLMVSVVGGDPANLTAALYDSAGTTRLAAPTTAVTVSAIGGINIPFASSYTPTVGTLYWVGFFGDASNSNFFGTTTSSPNSTAVNRLDAALGATLPAGAATSVRFSGVMY